MIKIFRESKDKIAYIPKTAKKVLDSGDRIVYYCRDSYGPVSCCGGRGIPVKLKEEL